MIDESMVLRARFCSATTFAVALLAAGCSPTTEAPPNTAANPVFPASGGSPAPGGFAGGAAKAPVNVPAAGSGGGVTTAAGCPATIFQQKCKTCHDGRGTAGTPMGLVNYEDFLAPAKTKPTVLVYKMVQTRVHDTAKPMPMAGMLPATDLASIDAWVAGGAKDCGFTHATATGAAGSSGGAAGAAGGPGGVTGAAGGAAGPIDLTKYLSPDGTYFIKEPPGDKPIGPDAKDAEFCFNLVAHGAQKPLPTDMTPFNVPASEFYHAFDYKVPYTKTMVALSTKPIIDNNKVLHHWLLFHIQSDSGTDGKHADEIGLQIGKEMVAGWAPGGNPSVLPPDVGLEMPKVGGFMTLETHYFNNTGAAAADRSGVRICMTSKIPTNVATLTWLGTESINIPANGTGTATGTCTPGVQTGDIHMINAAPHMHQLGSHMKTVINRKAGGTDVMVDEPFAFTDQREYDIGQFVIHPGDTLTTTCTWKNTTPKSVSFGTSTTAEMCYNFVYSYPAHALPNPLGGGIEGSSNMCLL